MNKTKTSMLLVLAIAPAILSFVSVDYKYSVPIALVGVVFIIFTWVKECRENGTTPLRAVRYHWHKFFSSKAYHILERYSIFEYKSINDIEITNKYKIITCVDDCCVFHGKYNWSKGQNCSVVSDDANHKMLTWDGNFLLYFGCYKKSHEVEFSSVMNIDKSDFFLAGGNAAGIKKITLEVRFPNKMKVKNTQLWVYNKSSDTSPTRTKIEIMNGEGYRYIAERISFPIIDGRYELRWEL